MKKKTFLRRLGYSLANEFDTRFIENTDNPPCPNCNAKMQFHGDDLGLQDLEEYWECQNCGTIVHMEEVIPYVMLFEDPEKWKNINEI